MDFVWIYAKPFSYFAKSGLWNELEYSIKSVKKNYKGARIWVVGDDPAPLKANHIPVDRILTHKNHHPKIMNGIKKFRAIINHVPVERIENHPTKLDADMDVIKKFRTIIDTEIGDEFILMYDDIFLLQPLTYEDFQITYGRCKVEDIEHYYRAWSRQYKFLWKNTYRIIRNVRDDIYDWETHLPRLYNKQKLKDIIDYYKCDEIPLIATSLYAAHHVEETVVMDATVQFNLMNNQVKNFDEGFKCKFMNIMDESITPAFKDKMTEVFGEGTSFKSPHRRH